MQTKLTLRMEDDLIERAKDWARRRGVSLSQVVASVLEQLPSARDRSALSPWTQKLVGIAASTKARATDDAAVREAHLDHLARRHR
jgi:hypothetical protein